MRRSVAAVLIGGVVLSLLAVAYLAYRVVSLEERLAERPTATGAAPSAQVSPPPASVSAADMARIERQVTALSAAVDELRRRPARGKPAAPGADRPGDRVEERGTRALQEELARLRRDVEALRRVAASPGSKGLAQPEVQEALSQLVEGELEKRDQERREQRRAIGEQVMDGLVQDFADRAGLSDEQLGTLYPVFQQMREDLRASWRAMRDGEKDFAEVREAARAARERLDGVARDVLDEKQYELYEQEMEQRFGGRGGLFR